MDPELAPKPETHATPATAERTKEIDDLLDVEVRDGGPGSPLRRRRLVRRIAAAAIVCVLVAAVLASLQDRGVEKTDDAANVADRSSSAQTRDDGTKPSKPSGSTAHVVGSSERSTTGDGERDAKGVSKRRSPKATESKENGVVELADAASEERTAARDPKDAGSPRELASAAKGPAAEDAPADPPQMTAAELREARRAIDRELGQARFELEQGDAPAARRRWYALLAKADGIGDAELRSDLEARAGFAIARSYSSAKETPR